MTSDELDALVTHAVKAFVIATAVVWAVFYAYMPRATVVCVPTVDNGMCHSNINPAALIDASRVTYSPAVHTQNKGN